MSATAYYRVGQYYVDDSTPTAPALYRCTTAGDKTSSVWAKVTGGQFIRGEYSAAIAYAVGNIVVISAGANAGTYVCTLACTGVHPTVGAPNWFQLPMGTVGAVV